MKVICDGGISIIEIKNGICYLTLTNLNFDDVYTKKDFHGVQYLNHTKAVILDSNTLELSGTVIEKENPFKRIETFNVHLFYSHFIINMG